MKEIEHTKRFTDEIRNQVLERQKVTNLTQEFHQILRTRNVPHTLYAFTLTPSQSYVRQFYDWYDDDSRERLLHELYSFMHHRISSHCCSNYKRQTHIDKRIVTFAVIEHTDRETRERTVPHLHATLAIHPEWEEKFLECFKSTSVNQTYSLNYDCFRGSAFDSWKLKITDTHLERIYDLNGWLTYSTKDIDENYQGSMYFTHDGSYLKG